MIKQDLSDSTPTGPSRRKIVQGSAALGALSTLGFPAISLAQNKPIKIGVPTINSGPIAVLGRSSANGLNLGVKKFNDAGGLGGRKIELVVRDSKGNPQEAARVSRELVNNDGCEIILDCEASSAAFAIHEVARDLGVLCMHAVSETSTLSADPKMHVPTIFRCSRQSIHDIVAGAQYGVKLAKDNKLKTWMSISPDYAYGRSITDQFFDYMKRYGADLELVGQLWPKLGQPDFSEYMTRLAQRRPQAVFSAVYGGDLVSMIQQGNGFGAFKGLTFVSTNMADYPVLKAIKSMPESVYSANRYLRTVPKTQANYDWGTAYDKAFGELPTNWSWEAALGLDFLVEAMKKTNSADVKKMSDALRGMTIKSPFGVNGEITMRAEDQATIYYAIAWGKLIAQEPYMPNPFSVDWKFILEEEKKWKQENKFI